MIIIIIITIITIIIIIMIMIMMIMMMMMIIIIIIIIIINIFIAQIPYEYDQIRVTNIIQNKHTKLRIPTGERLTSWLFTRRGGVEFGTSEDKSI